MRVEPTGPTSRTVLSKAALFSYPQHTSFVRGEDQAIGSLAKQVLGELVGREPGSGTVVFGVPR